MEQNESTTANVDASETQARKVQAAAALNALSAALHGPRGEKRRQHEAAKEARREARKAKALQVLTTGDTGRKDTLKFNARFALTRAVSAVKDGATVEELQACTALQAAAGWAELAGPVAQYAEAKGVDVATVLAGLGCTLPEEAIAAPQRSAAAPAAPEAPKAQPEPQRPAKGRQGRARRAS